MTQINIKMRVPVALDYLRAASFEKGTVFKLLFESFKPLMNSELKTKLKRFDKSVFDNPETVGACLFLTQSGSQLIGLVSWDPRQCPKAQVGYNCIVPEFQNNGFSKQQLWELIGRLKKNGFTEITATTGDHPFYRPAQKMYESCGFIEIQRNTKSGDLRYGSIDYYLVL